MAAQGRPPPAPPALALPPSAREQGRRQMAPPVPYPDPLAGPHRRPEVAPPAARIAVGLVVRGGCVLVGRRNGPPLAGYAEFPGGKARPGESASQALLREVREETGIATRVERLLLRTRFSYYPHGALDLAFFLCSPLDWSVRPRLPFRWVSLEELPSLPFPPANAPVLRLLRSGGGGL